MLPKVFGVCQLEGGGSRLGLGGLHAFLELVEGHPHQLPLGFGGEGVPERGERAQVRRRGGEREGVPETGALVSSAVKAWVSSRREKEWSRARSRHRTGPSDG